MPRTTMSALSVKQLKRSRDPWKLRKAKDGERMLGLRFPDGKGDDEKEDQLSCDRRYEERFTD